MPRSAREYPLWYFVVNVILLKPRLTHIIEFQLLCYSYSHSLRQQQFKCLCVSLLYVYIVWYAIIIFLFFGFFYLRQPCSSSVRDHNAHFITIIKPIKTNFRRKWRKMPSVQKNAVHTYENDVYVKRTEQQLWPNPITISVGRKSVRDSLIVRIGTLTRTMATSDINIVVDFRAKPVKLDFRSYLFREMPDLVIQLLTCWISFTVRS